MTTLTINGNEYNIKYGYKTVARCGVIKEITDLEDLMDKGEDMKIEDINAVLAALPKILLAGLQKCHNDEFGYDYDTGDGEQEALDKAFDLVDDYFDENEDKDVIDLFNILTEEMTKNGFLAQMLQDQAEEPAPKAAKKTTSRNTKKATS